MNTTAEPPISSQITTSKDEVLSALGRMRKPVILLRIPGDRGPTKVHVHIADLVAAIESNDLEKQIPCLRNSGTSKKSKPLSSFEGATFATPNQKILILKLHDH